jgi:butyrate kinase
MTNLGSTCYAAVSLQVLANIPEMQAALVGDADFVPITGANP